MSTLVKFPLMSKQNEQASSSKTFQHHQWGVELFNHGKSLSDDALQYLAYCSASFPFQSLKMMQNEKN